MGSTSIVISAPSASHCSSIILATSASSGQVDVVILILRRWPFLDKTSFSSLDPPPLSGDSGEASQPAVSRIVFASPGSYSYFLTLSGISRTPPIIGECTATPLPSKIF